MHLPLNALRAFEVSARHLSFTRAAIELNVTQTAVSQQVKNLEDRLGVPLFRRLPRGLALTDEGLALLPVLADSFERIGSVLGSSRTGRFREVLTVAAVGTFAVGWLMPRLDTWRARTRSSTCASSPTTTGSTSPARGSTSRSASATAPGTAPRPTRC
jgi:LysR family transcriptional regulator of beta-lactamase